MDLSTLKDWLQDTEPVYIFLVDLECSNQEECVALFTKPQTKIRGVPFDTLSLAGV